MAANTHKLITNNFKNYSVNQIIESLTEPANTVLYMFAGKHTEYTGGDSNVAYPNNSIQSLNIDAYKQMIFGKRITSNDVSVMIPRYDWVSGTVYTQYDDKDGEIQYKNFYTVTRSGSNYYIFKCLFNNYGAPSTVMPDFNETSADDILFETSDGYQWKYLFTIPKETFDKFSTTDYIPVVEDVNVTGNSVFGSIDVIKVTSNGIGYNNYYSGQFNNDDIAINGNTLIYNIGTDASKLNSYYTTCIIKIVEGKAKGEFRKIVDYKVKGRTKQIVVNNYFITTPDSTSRYEISPYVNIYGDGNETTNAEARALVNAVSSNSVYKIEILNRGKNYCFATANIQTSEVISISNTATLSVVMPPKGGHGANVQAELGGTRLGISVSFSNNEGSTILSENDYRTVGVLKDPLFSNVQLTLSSISGTFISNEKLYQIRPIQIGGFVSITTGSNTITTSTINLKDSFKANDYVYISDLKGNEVTNILVADGGSGYVTGEKLTFNGSTANALAFAVTSNGVVKEVRFNSITGLAMSGSVAGKGFRNNHALKITGVTSGNTSATGYATVNSSGNIVSITLTSGGKGYQTETVNVEGLASYINGTPIFSDTSAQTFPGNTQSVISGTPGYIGLGATNRARFVDNDIVTYIVPTNNTAIGGLTNNTPYYVKVTNLTHLELKSTATGTSINFTSVPTSYQLHSLTPVSNSLVNAQFTTTISVGGGGFIAGQSVTITGINTFANTATGTAIVSSGALTGVTITDQGHSYIENETVTMSSATSTTNATATVDTANGTIKSAIIASGGTGYASAPTVGVATVSGSGASLTAVINTTSVSSKRMLTKVTSVTSSTSMKIEDNGLFTDSTASIFLANVGPYGIVQTFSSPTVGLQNSIGIFSTDSFVMGQTSRAIANIVSIQISGQSKTYSTFLQAEKYVSSTSINGTFIEDEKVTQPSPYTANAYMYFANTTNPPSLYLTEKQGNFLVSNVVTGADSGATLTINSIQKGDLVPWSGDVMYIQNMEPISRSNEQSETVKIILEL